MEFRRYSPLTRSNRLAIEFPLPACFFSSPRYDDSVSRIPRDPTLSGITEASSITDAPGAAGRGRLLQVLGMWFGMAAAIGNTIAAGIVRTPGDVAKLLPNVWMFLGVWILGGLYAFSGASSMAELGPAIPRSGGPAHKTAVQSASSSLRLPTGWPLAIAVMLGLQAVIYTIDGWDGVIYFGEEVRNPGRDVPRAIFGSVFSIMGIYLLLNLIALYILPMQEIAGNNFVLGAVAGRVFGTLGDSIIRSIMIISMLSCLNANQLFCSRTLYAMSCDGLFFRRARQVNAGGTPTVSLFLSTVVGVLFVLVSFLSANAFERVIAMLSFFFVANYTLSYFSLFALRSEEHTS